MPLKLEISNSENGPIVRETRDGSQLKGDALTYKSKSSEGYQSGDLILTSELTPTYFNMRFKEDKVPHPSPFDMISGIFEGDFDFGYIKLAYQVKEILPGKNGEGQIKMQAVRIEDDMLVEIRDSNAKVLWSASKLNEAYTTLRSLAFAFNLSKGMGYAITQGSIAVGSSVIGAAMKTKTAVAIAKKLFPKGVDSLRKFRTATFEAVKLLRAHKYKIMFLTQLSDRLTKALIENGRPLVDLWAQKDRRPFTELVLNQLAYCVSSALAYVLGKMTAKALKLDKFSDDVDKMFSTEGNPYIKWFCAEFSLTFVALVRQYADPFTLFEDYVKRRYGSRKPQPQELYHIKDSFIKDFVNSSMKNSMERVFDKWTDIEFAFLKGAAK